MRILLLLLTLALPLTAHAETYRERRFRELQVERAQRHARIAARAHVGRPVVNPSPWGNLIFFPAVILPSRYETRFVIRDLETGRLSVVRERVR